MNRRLDIGPLATLCAVAETGSLNRAALKIHRSQAAVSQQMQSLEAIVGKPLLSRSRNGAVLTAQGRTLLAYARRMLALHDEALVKVSEEGPEGELHLGIPDDYADRVLPRLLSVLGEELPRVKLQLTCVPSPVLTRLQAEGRIDLALITEFADPRPDRGALRVEGLNWVARADAPILAADPLPVAISHQDSVDARAITRSLHRSGRRFDIVATSPSAAGVVASLRAGLAVAVLSDSAVPDDLCQLGPSPDWPPLPRVQLLARPDNITDHPLLQAVMTHLRKALSSA